ncbi:uncharacterized protein LOC9645394 isoform X3 [Selaginella moellendorffii]|uniref:uncharacterized protein LOC9645394 isoform X3 n=1 Tax=Selaginella moellendorffii TaxID=88036 RepID=UPI000D1C4E69|nr:uncharacterized protein LOC9645394 isoform X3 [Selaginella moellendorffii]|eukprot:XP_024522154.1 uncharacterized protein LOC9645394 isoform X3 [Selaginella moellendorffii]
MRGGIASSWVEVGVGGFSSIMPPTLRSMPPPPQRVMSGARVLRSLRKLAAYCSLMAFSCLLVVKLGSPTSSAPPHRHDLFFHLSWWMCRALMPADEESLTDDIIWETLPHFWISVSMVFFVAATVLTLLKLTGDFESLGWWDLFINYAIAECFSFLVCTKWTNTSIRGSLSSSSSSSSKPLERDESLCSASSTSIVLEDEGIEAGFCGKEDIGGHLLKAPVLISQILLCMKLEGTPAGAVNIPVGVVLMPLMVVQGLAILLTVLRVVERLLVLMHVGDESQSSLNIFSQVQEFFGFVHHGSRLLGWWSIDEKSKEEQVRLLSASSSGYYTFTGPPPDVVKKMARKDLAEEIWRLQAALGEQTRIAKHQQHEFDRLQSEKVLCRVCFERDIAVVLLPCKHRVLCSLCSERCKHCPICRSYIGDRLSVYDV